MGEQTVQPNQNSSPQQTGTQQPRQPSSNGQTLFEGIARVTDVGMNRISARAISQDELSDQLGQGSSLEVTLRVNDNKVLQEVRPNQLVQVSLQLGPTAEEQETALQQDLRRRFAAPAASSSSEQSGPSQSGPSQSGPSQS